MSSSAELHLLYRVANAPVLEFPFPHCFIRDVFPADFYALMQRHLPESSSMIPIGQAGRAQGYQERFVLQFKPEDFGRLSDEKRKFWEEFAGWLVQGRVRDIVLRKFGPAVEKRIKSRNVELTTEAFLIEDLTNYRLGPHTDLPKKIITMLFYLPKDDSQSHLGTSVYLPVEEGFACPAGRHHAFEKFSRIATMPFVPNSVFIFPRTNNSFHGVEPVNDPDCRRWLMAFHVFANKRQSSKLSAWKSVSALRRALGKLRKT